jgi:hypothetical protein
LLVETATLVIAGLSRFSESLIFVVIPSTTDGIPITVPIAVVVRLCPILFQLILKSIIPVGKFLSILGARAVPESISVFAFFVGGLTTRRDRFFTRSLLDGVTNVLVSVRLFAAKIVFGLIPVTFESCFDAIPPGIVFFIPPLWIACL